MKLTKQSTSFADESKQKNNSYPSVYIVDDQGTLHPELHMSYYGAGGYDTNEVVDKLDELLREKYRND